MSMTAAKLKAVPNTESSAKELELVHHCLGKVHYAEGDLIHFPQGLLGYEKNKYYILVEREEYAPFIWMVSTEEGGPSFLMVNPLIFRPDYNPNISRRELNELQIDSPQSLQMYVIVTLNHDMYKTTGNLSGPILLNLSKRIGKQLVLLDDKYSTKHPILKSE